MKTRLGEMEQELAYFRADNDGLEQKVVHVINRKLESDLCFGLQCVGKKEECGRGQDRLNESTNFELRWKC